MTVTEKNSKQDLRHFALDAQLTAIDAQASALVSMDREHSFGIESSHEVNRIRELVHSFVGDAVAIAQRIESSPLEQSREAAKGLLKLSATLKTDADNLRKRGCLRAEFRHDHLLSPQAGEQTVPSDPEKLKERTDFSCLRAEVDEYAAYALQVHAICNLALEYCLNALLQRSKCTVNI